MHFGSQGLLSGSTELLRQLVGGNSVEWMTLQNSQAAADRFTSIPVIVRDACQGLPDFGMFGMLRFQRFLPSGQRCIVTESVHRATQSSHSLAQVRVGVHDPGQPISCRGVKVLQNFDFCQPQFKTRFMGKPLTKMGIIGDPLFCGGKHYQFVRQKDSLSDLLLEKRPGFPRSPFQIQQIG